MSDANEVEVMEDEEVVFDEVEAEEEDVDEDSDYAYPSEDEEDEVTDAAIWERNVRAKENFVSPWMDADEQDFRLWGDGSSVRMSIFSSLRQIVNSACKKRVLCSKDDLFGANDLKVVRIFLEVMDGMTVVYSLTFDSTKAMSTCPPLLKCITYCGQGTYLFPNLLLPNCLGPFIDYGKVFDHLATNLVQHKSSFSSFIMITEDSPYFIVQEVAYFTQYRTSFVFELTDSGIVTGLERERQITSGGGVGYSDSSYSEKSSTLKKDDSAQYHLMTLLVKLCNSFDDRLLDSPLTELVSGMIAELSVEEITRSAQYAEAIFNLVVVLQQAQQKQSAVVGFGTSTLSKLATFKDILMDEYGLKSISIPDDIMASLKTTMARKSPGKAKTAAAELSKEVSAEDDGEVLADPVIFIDSLFTRHSYLNESTATGKTMLKRMKIEFNTLSTSLPPSIRYMVSEENFSLGKFLIVGPADTPYHGGYFLFDLKLPDDYPTTSPSVNFLTTGGGSVRFNPNLYQCGKVCLSLLGTWSGEKWDPQLSNINQVLQSICYLIFVEDPYFNEPGYHRNPQTISQSKQYNISTRRSTVRAAYLDHLTHPDPYFGDMIRTMMQASWAETKVLFEKWASEDPGGGILMRIAEIEAILGKSSGDAKKAS